ncbi:MAG: hypothetical protein JSS82_05215 [Bacteroidetes bacterium]|nr:hypothetical protein [Bacteroidota bacterium]
MPYKKEHLEGLLKLIDEISNTPGNEWFIETLNKMHRDRIHGDPVDSQLTSLINIHDDLKRTKYYLKNIDRKNWREAFSFYKVVSQKELRATLCADFKEMKIAEIEANWFEFVRRIILQIESIVNALIEKEDAFNIIETNPELFINNKDKFKFNLFEGDYSFFNADRTPKALKNIGFPSRMTWIRIYYGISYSFSSLNDMLFIRNKGSHRGSLTNEEEERLNAIEANWLKKNTEYISCFKAIANPLKGKL